MKTLMAIGAIALLAIGCDEQRDDVGPAGGIQTEARAWDCEEDDSTLTCTAAITADDGEAGAYACMPGDDARGCPPIEVVDGFVDERFGDLPWACLLTGEHQRHCLKEILGDAPDEPTPENPGDTPTEPGGDGDAYPDDPVDPDDPGVGQPEIPGDCEPASWEPYFCDLATSKYRAHGVDIAFPCDIFDAFAPFTSTFPDIPQTEGSNPDAPSCHDGEWAMRDQAWLDAVMGGCLNLNDPILVMCQQAANYAPNSGACNATGTW